MTNSKIGALWRARGSGERGPYARGMLEVRDKETAQCIADDLLAGKPVRIILWAVQKDPESRRSDWDITIDRPQDEIPF